MYGEISYNKSGKALEILDEKLELEEVGEPSDLIWENVGYPQKLIFRNQLFVIFSMTAFLLVVLYFSTVFQVAEYQKVKGYPQLIDCESISSQFDSVDLFKELAEYDKQGTIDNHGHGFYQCYCKEHSESVVDEDHMCYDYRLATNRYLMVTGLISGLVLAIN